MARASSLRRGRVRAGVLGPRRLALYRDAHGQAHAIDARCPHLGADLSQGRVTPEGLRCAFHGWTFGADGACRAAPGHRDPPGRCARVYPLEERWNLLWLFNGPRPLFALPTPDPGRRWRTLMLPAQRVACHPHLVLANGLDLAHYETLHGMTFDAPPTLDVARAGEVSVELRGRPRSRLWQRLSGTSATPIVARFTTIGGSLAWSTVNAPTRFHVLFTGRPDATGGCVTRTLFFFPTPPGPAWLRGLGLMATLLRHDRRVLDGLEFRPAFAETDAPLRAFATAVDALGAW